MLYSVGGESFGKAKESQEVCVKLGLEYGQPTG